MGGDSNDPLWLTPKQAIDDCRRAFGLDEGAARRRLLKLAAQDIVRTWCANYHHRDYDEWTSEPVIKLEDMEIAATFWDRFERWHGGSADWGNGMFVAKGAQTETTVHGVRFSGLDLANHKRKLDGLPPLSPPPKRPTPITPLRGSRNPAIMPDATPRKARRRAKVNRADPVTYDELIAWHTTLAPVDAARGWRWIRDEAKGHFNPRSVPQKHVLELVKGRPLGRPRKP
jgi:hypothetical protein